MQQISPISIYINWPFKHEVSIPDLHEFYLKELNNFEQLLLERRLKSVYFGGGHTSLTPIKMTEKILIGINDRININDDTEITIEVNPGLTSQQKLKDLKKLGITRASVTAKSLNDKAINTIELASRIFDNYSFDLFYARPSQSLTEWQAELKQAVNYIRRHISLHQFTTSKSDSDSEMFKANMEILASHAIHQYEISNYAIKTWESLHNLAYYNYDEYLGIGPGARSRIMRNRNVLAMSIEKNPNIWLKKLSNNLPTTTENKTLSPKQIAYEYIIMNLRKSSGLVEHDFFVKFNRDIHKYLDKNRLNAFQSKGWLHYTKERIIVTEAGRIFLDKIILDIVKDNVEH